MTKPLTVQARYDIPGRRITGTHDEKLEQIDEAIQELLDIKLVECASEHPGARFIAVPRRPHWFAMTVTILILFVILMLLGVRASHAQTPEAAPATSDTAASTPATQPPTAPVQRAPDAPKAADPFAFADFTWLSGNPRTREAPLDTKAFTGEFRADTPSQTFLGFMAYNRLWFARDRYALTVDGGAIDTPGRYLVLVPPINGAAAASGTPYFTANPGDPYTAWDTQATFDYMPSQFITFRSEFNYRHANVPYFVGEGGVTPPAGNTGAPGSLVPGWAPDLRPSETRVTFAMLVKL